MLLTPDEVDRTVAEAFPAMAGDGMRCEEIAQGLAVIRWTHDATRLRPGGYIPGPVQFAAADLALWAGTWSVVGIALMAVTADLHMTFLRPGVGGDLLARCRILRVGRSRVHGVVELWVDGAPDRLISHATGSYTRG